MGDNIDLNLGIRARRSKKINNVKGKPDNRNPLINHTMDDDLPYIKQYAEMYNDIPEEMKNVLNMYVFDNKPLDYYYGAYVTAYQMFVMAHCSKNDIALTLMSLIHVISFKFIKEMTRQKNQIASVDKIDDIKN